MSTSPIPLVPCSSALNRCKIPGMDWCINPYVGCAHACVYCYASFMKRFTGHDEPWGTFVEAKENFAAVLARQVRRPRSGTVMIATVTDAWQPLEREAGITRACLEKLVDTGLAVSILTKSDLVLRDLDVLRAFGGLLQEDRVRVGFSIPVLSDDLAAFLEPGAPPPSRRLDALEHLSDAGISTWVFVAPILPGLGDSPTDLAHITKEARRRGARDIDFDPLNFYPAAVSRLTDTIRRYDPRALPAFLDACRGKDVWRSSINSGIR